MALHTRSASSGATVEIPFTARETVAMETPARCATSRMLALAARSRFGFFLGPPTGKPILEYFLGMQEWISAKICAPKSGQNAESMELTLLGSSTDCARG